MLNVIYSVYEYIFFGIVCIFPCFSCKCATTKYVHNFLILDNKVIVAFVRNISSIIRSHIYYALLFCGLFDDNQLNR